MFVVTVARHGSTLSLWSSLLQPARGSTSYSYEMLSDPFALLLYQPIYGSLSSTPAIVTDHCLSFILIELHIAMVRTPRACMDCEVSNNEASADASNSVSELRYYSP